MWFLFLISGSPLGRHTEIRVSTSTSKFFLRISNSSDLPTRVFGICELEFSSSRILDSYISKLFASILPPKFLLFLYFLSAITFLKFFNFLSKWPFCQSDFTHSSYFRLSILFLKFAKLEEEVKPSRNLENQGDSDLIEPR